MAESPPMTADRDADDRLVAYGWAPGSYLNNCGECKEKFIGDKRAPLCRACAAERKIAEQASDLAALRRRVAPEWQLIKTAPKDGTEILGWWSASKCCLVISWCADGWTDQADNVPISAPTHWQPISPPAEESESGT